MELHQVCETFLQCGGGSRIHDFSRFRRANPRPGQRRLHGGERAIICSVTIREPYYIPDHEEFFSLVTSAGAEVVGELAAQRQRPSPANYIGVGKVEELAALVEATEADLVIFDGNLSPSQELNLEKQVQARVIDRSGLILDIFASRAKTFEGKLQVELAQLDHIRTRLIRGWKLNLHHTSLHFYF